jgi:hypothetical protein
MEYHNEGYNYLEDPRFINNVDVGSKIVSGLLHEE